MSAASCYRFVIALAMVCGFTVSAQDPFTLEQVLGFPFPSDLTAAPSGGSIAWIANARGVRNVWVADPPYERPRAITSYSADDGQEISSLRWTPDARSILYVRGGEPNSQGIYPNPLSDPAGAQQAIWIVPVGGGQPRRLAEGHSPEISPKGDTAAFLLKGQIWRVAVKGDPGVAPLIHARGECANIRWSPEGDRIAFVNRRDDNSYVGVYNVAERSVRYIDPSVDRDSDPVWSPDGRQVAFRRVPASRELLLFGPKRDAEPWSIRAADASTGKGRQIWKATPGPGSVFRPIEGRDQLLWADGERLVFPWEADGWTHLYAVNSTGGDAVPLTEGAFEVGYISLSTGRRDVLIASNQDDLDRRHIWRVSPKGGPPVAITNGDGIEWSPVATADSRAVAFLRSSARSPARTAVLIGSGSPKDLLTERQVPPFPEVALVEPVPVSFKAADGLLIHGQLFLPRVAQAGERGPAVVFLHGGSRRQMLLGWHGMAYYHNAYAMNQFLASQGYVVLSVNYRSGTGYGMDFREALDYGARGASEFQDVVAAGHYLQSRSDVDAKRIGLWGGSYGGYLTALGLARASDLFAAGVDLHGVHDWRTETRLFAESDTLSVQQEALKLAFDSSPLADVQDWRSPVLLIHGDDDRDVEFKQTVQLVEALRKQNVTFEQLIFPDEIHEFLVHARWLQALHAAADFFEKHLRQASE